MAGNRFLGVSKAAHKEFDRATQLRFASLTSGWTIHGAGSAQLLCEKSDFEALYDDGAYCQNALSAFKFIDATALSVHATGQLVAREGVSSASQLSPPYAGLLLQFRSDTLMGLTDLSGLGQLFVYAEAGLAAISNSSTLLARLFHRQIDQKALIGFANLGMFFGQSVAFQDIAKVDAATAVTLVSGVATFEVVADAGEPAIERTASVTTIATRLRETMVAFSDAYQDADFELSGGLDSRLLLAALPRELRKRHQAFTLGDAGDADVRIAGDIANRYGMRHKTVSTNTVVHNDMGELLDALNHGSELYDFGANPVDKATLLLANAKHHSAQRFNGQNGELIRGFYYPGQPLNSLGSEQVARRLIKWRLVANELVDPELFKEEIYQDLQLAIETDVLARLLSNGDTWSQSLDNFYLFERMQRWVGNGAGGFVTSRQSLMPFFEAGFIKGAFGLDASRKSNSRAAYQALALLDADLARIRLDNHVKPISRTGHVFLTKAAEARGMARKAVLKASRFLRGGHHATVGSQSVIDLWFRHEQFRKLPLHKLASTGLFNEQYLENLGDGKIMPDRPTLGFLVLMANIPMAD